MRIELFFGNTYKFILCVGHECKGTIFFFLSYLLANVFRLYFVLLYSYKMNLLYFTYLFKRDFTYLLVSNLLSFFYVSPICPLIFVFAYVATWSNLQLFRNISSKL